MIKFALAIPALLVVAVFDADAATSTTRAA